jgi:hypothetical protein
MSEFRFKIGDLIMHKDVLDISKRRFPKLYGEGEDSFFRESTEPETFRVLELHTYECYGGVQRFYLCRLCGCKSCSEATLKISEPEAVAFPEITYKAAK